MDAGALHRWLKRHPAEERLRVGFELMDVAMSQLIDQLRRDGIEPTAANVRARIWLLKGG